MSSVLSQNEVDALLKGISGGEFEVDEDAGEDFGEEEVIPFDLTSQDRIIRGPELSPSSRGEGDRLRTGNRRSLQTDLDAVR